MSSFLARFKKFNACLKDPSGVAAVEFGLILPLLAMLFLGAVEYSRATMVSTRFNQVTAMASDLIAREYLLVTADMTGISEAIDTVWDGLDNLDTLKFSIKHVRSAGPLATKKPPGTTYVEWSASIRGAPTPPNCQNYTLPVAGMLSQGNSVIVVSGTYTYRSLFGNISIPLLGGKNFEIKNAMNWTSESSHAPRDLCVAYNKPNCISTCE